MSRTLTLDRRHEPVAPDKLAFDTGPHSVPSRYLRRRLTSARPPQVAAAPDWLIDDVRASSLFRPGQSYYAALR